MKKYLYLLLLVGLIVVSFMACTRSTVSDPSMNKPSSFRLFIQSRANPSTLYVSTPAQQTTSTITARLYHNDGSPATNYTLVFELIPPANAVSVYGSFWGNKLKENKATNSSGEATVTYYIPAGSYISQSHTFFVKIRAVDDGRHNNPIAIPDDIIPIDIVTVGSSTGNKVEIWGYAHRIPMNVGISEAWITITSTGGEVFIAFTNDTGMYSYEVDLGFSGTVAASKTGYTFFPESYTVDTLAMDTAYHFKGYYGAYSRGASGRDN